MAAKKTTKPNGNGFSIEDVDLLDLARRAKDMSDDQKRDLLRQLSPKRIIANDIEREQGERYQATVDVPRNDDQLHALIIKETGFDIPRVAVCDDHCAPFDFISDAFFNRKRALLVLGSRESGKCLPGDTLIYDSVHGDRVRLDDVVDGRLDQILTMTPDGDIVEAPITFRFATGRKECFRVRTLAGREVEVTGEHPFMTSSGWVRCDELEEGVHIATPSRIPFASEPQSIPEHHVDLLAVLLAEGTYTHETVGFSTDSQKIWSLMHEAAELMGCDLNHRSAYDYGFSKRLGRGLYNPIRKMLDSYGIGRELSKNKIIPESVFRLPRDQMQRFLSLFWMCDGYIEKMNPGITLASKRMVEQIQHLLLRFGVQSKIEYKLVKLGEKEFDSWRLTVYGNCIPAFAEAVNGLWGEKRARLDACVARDRCPTSGRPTITPEMLEAFRDRFPARPHGAATSKSNREAYEMLGWRPARGAGVSMLTRGKVINLQARRLRALCHAHSAPEDEFSVLLNADLWWDPIVSIDSVGEKDVYDLTMFPTSSFVANDVVVHNTLGVSIVHYINAEIKPGYEGCTFGAVQSQAKRAYKHVKSFIYTIDPETGDRVPKPQILGDPTRSETNWKTGSMVEIIVGTASGVNSPHPNTVHADELDLMQQEVFDESRSMASSSIGRDGVRIPAQDIATSTRKSTKGLMQKLLDEVAESKRNGHKPAWEVYAYCVAEIAAEVPCCRCVDPIDRVRRLVKLNRNPHELCGCDITVKGTWGTRIDDTTGHEVTIPRTLESVCRGRFFRSRGWMHYDDIVGKFMQNSQAVWDAQMECRRPMADGLYLANFSRQRNCVRGWVPRPEYGRIAQGIDWGGAAPSVVVWFQGPMHHPVEITGFDLQKIIVPQGGYVIFDMIEAPGIGATKLGDQVVAREVAYRNKFPGWRVRGRFADMAGRQQRDDWREHDPPLRTHWYISRDFDPTVETMQDLVNDAMLYVDVIKCASLCDDFEAWRQEKGKEVHDESTHGPAASRYGLTNIHTIERKAQKHTGQVQQMPVVREREILDPSGALAAVASVSSTGVETEQWRRSFGPANPEDVGSAGVQGWRL